jgi:hypothetical protein
LEDWAKFNLPCFQPSNFIAKFGIQKPVVVKLQVMVEESKAKLWDSITYFATTTQKPTNDLVSPMF